MSAQQTNEDFVVVERCESEFAAHALVALLADYDIAASVAKAGPYALAGSSSNLRHKKPVFPVLVPESKLELARLTIQDARSDASALDWNQVDLGERTDQVPLSPVSEQNPWWLQGIAIAGLTLLGLTIIGFIIVLMMWT